MGILAGWRKTSASIAVNKLYCDNILNSAEYSTPLTISGTATVSSSNVDTYAVELSVKTSSGVVVDTLWVYNLTPAKNGNLSWSIWRDRSFVPGGVRDYCIV